MKKIFFGICLVVATCFALSSCEEGFDIDNGANFQTESFDNFLWKKQPPVKIEAEIEFDFDECEGISKPLVLQLCDDSGNPITPRVAQLYVEGQRSEDNTITIDPNGKEEDIDIEIILDDSQIHNTRTFTWNLQVVENPGLVKVNDRKPDKDPWIAETTMNWKNKHVANPLRVGTDISLSTILAILVAWILLAQLILFPKFKQTQTKRIFVMIDGGRKNIVGYNSSANGSKEIVLTPEDKKQGFFGALFFGKVTYIRIKSLPGEISLTPGSGKYQTKATIDRKKYEIVTSGEMNELKTVKSLEGDASVEFYAKSK